MLLCVLVGFIYAAGLYYRTRHFAEQSALMNKVLGALRWITVTIICLLLLEPVLRSVQTQQEDPVIVFAQDNSSSVAKSMSETTREAYTKDVEQLKRTLDEQYSLKNYVFGAEMRLSDSFQLTDPVTNIAMAMQELYDTYSNQNVGAVILSSDGIYNQGTNPLYLSAKLGVPVYTVGLGDTIPKKDLLIKKVYNNQIAYLGDAFMVQVDVAAINCSGKRTRLEVLKGKKVLTAKEIDINDSDFFITTELELDANQAGLQKYTVRLSSIDGEATLANNQKDFYVDVLDARQKILIIAESPHPDIAALRRAISKNKNYEVTLAHTDKFKEQVASFDFVILHQLPSQRNGLSQVYRVLKEKKIPHMYIVGSQTNLQGLNQLQNLVSIMEQSKSSNAVMPSLNPQFNAFVVEEPIQEMLKRVPPMITRFGTFKASADADVLLRQRIRKIETDYPLLVTGERDGAKVAVLAAEGLWKWRLFNFAEYQSHNRFDEFVGKLVQYLCTKDDKRKFRARVANPLFTENESVIVDAELYNDNYERINDPEAELIITNEKGEQFLYSFSRINNTYTVNAGRLPEGRYIFEASTGYNNEVLKAKGAFTVKSIQLEVFETTARHGLLRLISNKTGGEFVQQKDIQSLAELIAARGTVKPVLFDSVQTRGLIHLKWIFFLLVTLLSIEWFARRYFGSY